MEIVKGKLNLCSPPGLVATVGVVVLMVGIAMAVLGYWPHEGHSQGYASRVSPAEERRDNGRMSYSKSRLVSVTWNNNKDNNTANQTVGEFLTKQTVGEFLTNQTVGEFLTNQTVGELTNQTVGELTNQTSVFSPLLHLLSHPSGGLLSEFLDNYLYSDNLKVFGPLVMGIGIFIFICANAVLHENRDKKTKVINLRDIYSTVIDLHSTRTKDYSPSNGLVDYVQSRGSVDVQRCSEQVPYPRHWDSEQASLPRQWDSEQASLPRQWDSEQASYPRQWDSEQASLPRQWDSDQASYPRQWEGIGSIVSSSVKAFKLPVIKLNSCEVEEKGVQAERVETEGCLVEEEGGQTERKETEGCLVEEGGQTRERGDRMVLGGGGRGAQGSQLFPPPTHVSRVMMEMGSRLSLNSLSRARRLSCPRLERSNSKRYIKLETMGGESFEAVAVATSRVPDSNQEEEREVAVVQGEEEEGGGVTVTLSSSLSEL
ncbi:transmembrane protein 200A-like [Salvelinus sp. IW2-2015]|uniref:transmembrane protein 200A-like n=1 Tax=Salvelinus sp. IW2-2015 TaxID=2691554 RepID=UPI0038D4C037